MKKVSKILLAVTLFAAIAIAFYYFGVKQEVFSGITVMSISNAHFVTSSPDLNYKDAYLVDVIVNKGGEQLVGKIDPADLAQFGIKAIPEGPFKIYMNLKDVSCNYNIIDDNTLFYKIYQATTRSNNNIDAGAQCPWGTVSLDSVKANCKNQFGEGARGTTGGSSSPGSPISGGNCDSLVDIQTTPLRPELGGGASEWCYAMLPDATGGGNHWRVTHIAGIPWMRGYKIDTTANPDFVVEIILENSKGEKVNSTLTPQQQSIFLSDIGRAKFVGSLVAQEFCPVPGLEKNIIKTLGTNVTTVVKRTDYDNYQNILRNLQNFDNNYYEYNYVAPQPARVDPGVGADALFSQMSSLNAEHRILATQNIQDNCRIEGMIYKCTPTKDILYPELQLIIKASWLGVSIPSGMPKIANIITQPKNYEGDVNRIAFSLSNTGDTADSFDTALICNEGQISLGSIRTSLDKAASSDVSLNYVAKSGVYNCFIKSTSFNNPLNTDAKNLTVSVLLKPLPTPDVCTNVPTQPCDRALWQAYPICKWDTNFCTAAPKSNTLMYVLIGIAVVFVAMILIMIRKPKRGKRK